MSPFIKQSREHWPPAERMWGEAALIPQLCLVFLPGTQKAPTDVSLGAGKTDSSPAAHFLDGFEQIRALQLGSVE